MYEILNKQVAKIDYYSLVINLSQMNQTRSTNISERLAERKFNKWKAVHRNKNIYDIRQIDTFENIQQKKRRTPYKSLKTTDVGDKLTQSFMNSTNVFSCKLDNQIEKHKTKVNNSFNNSKRNTQCINESLQIDRYEKQPIIKGVSMDKMTTRQYRQSLGAIQNNNQRRFNNFAFMRSESGKVRSFQKYLSREELQKLRMQTVPDSNPDIPIIYEKLFFPSTTFSVNWDYKRQKWDRGPIFFKINQENSANLNEIGAQRVERGRTLSTAEWGKTWKNWKSVSTKDNPSQFQRIFYPPNMNFRQKKPKAQNSGKSIKIKQKAKEPQFQRWELCDVKYFRLKTGKQKKRRRFYTE